MTLKEWWAKHKDTIRERAKIPVVATTKEACKYRRDRNANNMAAENCCFIGATILPKEYRPNWDKTATVTASKVLRRLGVALSPSEEKAVNLLQSIHDRCGRPCTEERPEDWPKMVTNWERENAALLE